MNDLTNLTCITCSCSNTEQAEAFSTLHHIPICKEPEDNALHLDFSENGIALIRGKNILQGDFTRLLPRIQKIQHELILRAVKIKSLSAPHKIIDATAGLGEDAFLMAAAGHSLQLLEHNPVIALLLRDALKRAENHPDLAPVAARMTLTETESISYLQTCDTAPDVVYLDPMFPERKKSAAVSKKPQFLQQLEAPCEEEQELMQGAMTAHPKRIVVKRPPHAPYLAGVTPTHTLERKGIRFDCITLS